MAIRSVFELTPDSKVKWRFGDDYVENNGTSGLILPVPNKLHYPEAYQEKSRLAYYGLLMGSIEINSSFYKIPLASTVKKWGEDVPEDFRFSFKLFKGVTHAPQLGYDVNDVSRFFEVINQVGEKKGCLLVQFPPSIRISSFPQLAKLMVSLREYDADHGWKIALECRHSSLYVEEVYELLEEYKLSMVIHDKGAVESPFDVVHNSFNYLRFHGPGGNYRGSYSGDVLAEYAGYIAEWLAEDKQVFVYFNNTMGDAYGNLTTLKEFVRDLV